MRALLQRVSRASVEVDGNIVGSICSGLLIFFGAAKGDSEREAVYLARKAAQLRIFPDDDGKMNRSVSDAGGSVLVVSQFTLYGDCRKGRRPSFDKAASPQDAARLYLFFIEQLVSQGLQVATGVFQAHMIVSLVNDGPVTFLLEPDN